MSIKIKLYVLCCLFDTKQINPKVFSTQELAYAEMNSHFNVILAEYGEDGYDEEKSIINGTSAVIVSGNERCEWTITECELEINNPQEIMEALREHLVSHSTAFAKYVQEAPQKFGAFAGWLLEVRDLLRTAVDEVAADESVSDDV